MPPETRATRPYTKVFRDRILILKSKIEYLKLEPDYISSIGSRIQHVEIIKENFPILKKLIAEESATLGQIDFELKRLEDYVELVSRR